MNKWKLSQNIWEMKSRFQLFGTLCHLINTRVQQGLHFNSCSHVSITRRCCAHSKVLAAQLSSLKLQGKD